MDKSLNHLPFGITLASRTTSWLEVFTGYGLFYLFRLLFLKINKGWD